MFTKAQVNLGVNFRQSTSLAAKWASYFLKISTVVFMRVHIQPMFMNNWSIIRNSNPILFSYFLLNVSARMLRDDPWLANRGISEALCPPAGDHGGRRRQVVRQPRRRGQRRAAVIVHSTRCVTKFVFFAKKTVIKRS